ncbi:MAG TPA: hypothetical protein VIO37_12765 [Candidatus Dormibacteraeota bacterium]
MIVAQTVKVPAAAARAARRAMARGLIEFALDGRRAAPRAVRFYSPQTADERRAAAELGLDYDLLRASAGAQSFVRQGAVWLAAWKTDPRDVTGLVDDALAALAGRRAKRRKQS